MKDLQSVLSRLGLSQYFDKFKEEGFEQWETVLEITESDLYGFASLMRMCSADRDHRDALGVKLGHRRVSLAVEQGPGAKEPLAFHEYVADTGIDPTT